MATGGRRFLAALIDTDDGVKLDRPDNRISQPNGIGGQFGEVDDKRFLTRFFVHFLEHSLDDRKICPLSL